MNLPGSTLVRRAIFAALVAPASIAVCVLAARAEDYPTRSVKIIVQTAAPKDWEWNAKAVRRHSCNSTSGM
jgi:hypothetical protein